MNRRELTLGLSMLAVSACTSTMQPARQKQNPPSPNAQATPVAVSTPIRKAYIIHGFGASPGAHWFPWLANRLQGAGVSVDVPAMPNSLAPDFGRWQQTLEKHVGTPSAQDIFIAHSLGTISLLHFLSAQKPARIGGVILVSGFGERLPKLPAIQGYDIDAYVDQARLDIAAIQAMTSNIFCVISQNDAIVAPEESLKLARQLNGTVRMVPAGGHFLESDGFRELPAAWECAEAIIRSASGNV